MIYLDNSATSYPKPQCVIDAVKNSFETVIANPGRSSHREAIRTSMALYRARETVAEFVNTSPENVVFTYNATMALNMAIHGAVREGERVVTTTLEHNSVLRPLYALERDKRIKLDFLKLDTKDTSVMISDLEELFCSTEKPRVVVATHTSNVTGYKMPVAEIGRLCRKNGALFIVDGSQGLGTSRVDMERDCVDVLCSSGHKGIFGIMGSGFMAVSKDCTHILEPLMSGGSGIMSFEKTMPDSLPERLEAGTVGMPAVESMRAGIEYINSQSVEALAERSHKRRVQLTEGLSVIEHVELYAPEIDSTSIVLFNLEGVAPDKTSTLLDGYDIASRAGFHCSPLAHTFFNTGGAVRLSVSPFTTFHECDALLMAVYYLSKGL